MSRVLGHEFEAFVCNVIKKSSRLTVTQTKGSGDGGIDFFCSCRGEIAVGEIKSGNSIGTQLIRNFIGSMLTNEVKNGIFISKVSLTKDAKILVNSITPDLSFLYVQISETKLHTSKNLSESIVKVHSNKYCNSSLVYDSRNKLVTLNGQVL
eukprot:NODE_321_length_11054_cov_0.461524.p8 type:complete len:152 gc:universal NODE_321_length_11054_cov_0.461524:224-679(+)